MAENVYEGMFILDSNRYAARPGGCIGTDFQAELEGAGGRLSVSRLWEERRLAYAIDGHRKGTYWLTYFNLEGRKLAEVERNCMLDDAILRVLFLKVDPRIVDALLTHAQTSPGSAESPKGDDEAPVAVAVEAADLDDDIDPEAIDEED